MKLTKERIISAGMATFAEVGYHALSMRQVAERLGAHAGSLYYHVRSKDELLAMMADRVCRQAYDAGSAALAALPPDATWRQKLEVQAATLRRTLLAHPGGALLMVDSPGMLAPGALSLMERLLRTLVEAGVPVARGGIAADTFLSHITGFVLQEQSRPQAPALTADVYADLRERFPLLLTEMPQLPQDEKFQRSVQLLCGAFASLTGD